MATSIAFNGALRVACGGRWRLLEPPPGWRHDLALQTSTDAIEADNEWSGTANIAGMTDPAPEMIYRQGLATISTPIAYTVTGLQANTDYTVRVHFAAKTGVAAATYVFDIDIDGAANTSFDDKDPVALRGAGYGNYVEDVCESDANGELDITVTPNAAKFGLLCGFEVIIIAPDDETVASKPSPAAPNAQTPPAKPTPTAPAEQPTP